MNEVCENDTVTDECFHRHWFIQSTLPAPGKVWAWVGFSYTFKCVFGPLNNVHSHGWSWKNKVAELVLQLRNDFIFVGLAHQYLVFKVHRNKNRPVLLCRFHRQWFHCLSLSHAEHADGFGWVWILAAAAEKYFLQEFNDELNSLLNVSIPTDCNKVSISSSFIWLSHEYGWDNICHSDRLHCTKHGFWHK